MAGRARRVTDDQAHRETIAATLTAGLLAASQKPCTASRAIREYRAVLSELATPEPVPDHRAGPPAQRRDETPRVTWLPGASLNGNRE